MAEASTYNPIPELTESDYVRFWSKAILTANIEKCWDWQAHANYKGYGTFSFKRIGSPRMYYAPRVAYFSYFKINPVNKQVLHTCDNPKCINPHHLFLGTNDDNMKDKVSKGRQAKGNTWKKKYESILRGSKVVNSKLNESQVLQIREMYSLGNETHRSLGKQFKVDKSIIGDIVNRNAWKHI